MSPAKPKGNPLTLCGFLLAGIILLKSVVNAQRASDLSDPQLAFKCERASEGPAWSAACAIALSCSCQAPSKGLINGREDRCAGSRTRPAGHVNQCVAARLVRQADLSGRPDSTMGDEVMG